MASGSPPPASWIRENHPGLVWSNPNAPVEAYLRAALLRPRFLQLLDLASHYGLARLEHEWSILESENTSDAQRAAGRVRRILANMAKGAQ